MVLGLFEGELDLQLGSLNFSAGQKISGSVRIKLPQPLMARGLRACFYGEIVTGHGEHRRVEKIFEIVSPIAGEKTYQNGENYNFELQLPESLATPQFEGALAGILNFFTPKPRGWYVHATLDIPNKIDLNKKVQVNIISLGAPSSVNIANLVDLAKAQQGAYQGKQFGPAMPPKE